MDPSENWYDLSLPDIKRQIDGYFAGWQGEIPDKSILRNIYSFIDLTSLEGTDNEERIGHLCRKALSSAEKGLPYPAAVCVYPPFVRSARKQLEGTGIRVAAVAGFFPSGQAPLILKMEEVEYALGEGAEEIDLVMSRGKFLEGDLNYAYDEIASARELVKEGHLKVILETGELKTVENIKKAAEIAIAAGADFIKTSTGKILPAATEEAAFVMAHVIKEHFIKTGLRIGFKPSGGIAESSQALRYCRIVQVILGNDWLARDYFRIGASRLADNLIHEISM